MAIKEFNVDLDIKGRVLASTVPNSTGSIVTWNTTTNVFGLRTNAQIISDLGLTTVVNNSHTHNNKSVLDSITSAKLSEWSANINKTQGDTYYAPLAHVGTGGNAHALATTSEAGFMSPTDKTKLNGLTKPNNGKLTMNTGAGLSGSATFTADQSGASSFSVGIGSGYKLPTTSEWGAKPTKTEADTYYAPFTHTHKDLTTGTGLTGATYNGGTAREWKIDDEVMSDIALGKTAEGWGNHADEGYATETYVDNNVFSGNYNDLSNKPTIPTNNNQLTNGAGYITKVLTGQGLYSNSWSKRNYYISHQLPGGNNGPVTGDPGQVILLHRKIAYRHTFGTISANRSGSANSTAFEIDIVSNIDSGVSSYWTTLQVRTRFNYDLKRVIVTYNGLEYIAIQMGTIGQRHPGYFVFTGYHSPDDGTLQVLLANDPLITSIEDSSEVSLRNEFFDEIFVNNNKVYHQGNLTNLSQLNNDAGYITSSSLPTVNNGQLTLSTGTGLSGSATFTANQSGSSEFSVAVENTHKLPTTTEWTAALANTITRLRGTTSGTFTSGDLTLLAGANTTITQSGANITIASTNTNTTYSAGSGLSLTGTTFANTAPNATHTGDVTGATALTIANNAVTHAKYQNIATQRILGRGATGTGNVQELTLGSNLSLSTAGVLSATNTNTTYTAGTGISLSGTTFGQAITTSGTGTFVTGVTQTTNGFQINLGTPPNTNTTYTGSTTITLSGTSFQRAALTGDVTAAVNSNATTIANNAVTHDKYQNIATQTFLGRVTAGTGNVEALTVAQMKTALGVPSAYTLPQATATVRGGIEIFSNTVQTVAATAVSTTASRTYGIQLNSAGQAVVNVPWSNTNTTYSAGTGLSLSGTTFGQAITTSGSGTYVQSITQTSSGFQVNLGTPPNTNTTYSAGTLALLNAGTNTSNRVWGAKPIADYVKQYAGENLGLQGVTDIGNWTTNNIEVRLGNTSSPTDLILMPAGSSSNPADNAPLISTGDKGFRISALRSPYLGTMANAIGTRMGMYYPNISSTGRSAVAFSLGDGVSWGYSYMYNTDGSIGNGPKAMTIELDYTKHHTERLSIGTGQELQFPPESGTLATREWVVSPSNETPSTDPGVGIIRNGEIARYIFRDNFTINHSTRIIDAVDTTYTVGASLVLSGTQLRRAALTGAVTAPANSNVTTLSDKAVTLAKMADIATGSLIGRGAAGTGVPQRVTIGTNLALSTSNVLSATNTTYSQATLAQLRAGTNVSNRLINPRDFKEAVEDITTPKQLVISATTAVNEDAGKTIILNSTNASVGLGNSSTLPIGFEVYLVNNTSTDRNVWGASGLRYKINGGAYLALNTPIKLKGNGVGTLIRIGSTDGVLALGDFTT